MKRLSFSLLLLFVSTMATWAQSPDAHDTTVTMLHTRSLCPHYNVDSRVIDSKDALTTILDSLRQVQPNAYPIMSQWCRQQRVRINRMVNSLKTDYKLDGNIIWMDSTHCLVDAGVYLAQMEQVAAFLLSESEHYDNLEKERLIAEKRAAEERAKAEAARIQREKDLMMAIVKDSIKNLHKEITLICDARGVSDKEKVKELKNIYYAYLSVYNRYDLTDNNSTDNNIKLLDELQQFQLSVIDSVLGPNSLPVQIEAFKNTIHLRAGKDHTDVNKSYLRVFKKIHIPINFKTIAEYNSYLGQLKEIMEVQQNYLNVVDLRDTISHNTLLLQQLCTKKHKDIFASYKDYINEQNTIPAFASLAESEKFINKLLEIIDIQHLYKYATLRVDTIAVRGDSIIRICPKNIDDIVSAYKELVSLTDFIPKFINQASADRYLQTLDNFEQMQQVYISVIGIRSTIEKRSQQILNTKNAPRGLVAGYKQMMKYTDFTPHFNSQSAGDDFIKLLNHFIITQDKFIQIIDNNNIIDNNTKQFKNAFKEYTNIHKAYERVAKTYDMELSVLSEADLNSYLKQQSAFLSMQEKFVQLSSSLEKEDYNNRLKKVREPDKIKLIMGVN
ncbi:MAG: hypothetical protein J6Y98_06905 [Bacteroidales bacterium]|nr:hypothetical protein [Bacteroidales bacterium]